MPAPPRSGPALIVTADDYGYAPAYNRGMIEAARAGLVDSVSAMVGRRWCDPGPLLETGVEVGVHVELPGDLEAQLGRFEELFGVPPPYLDGHHHCHAAPPDAERVARVAAERGIAVRSVDPVHREMLRSLGVATPDRLLGRLEPGQRPLPELLAEGARLPPGVTEWMVHPGYADPGMGSAYDAARELDLNLLSRVSPGLARRARRCTHREALSLP